MASADHSPYQFAAERYVLRELSENEKLDFEDHFFSCGACAQDVEDLTAICTAAPSVLRELDASGSKKDPFAWLIGLWNGSWLRPFAVGAVALLMAVTTYQNAVQIPGLKANIGEPLGLTEEQAALHAERGEGLKQTIPRLPRVHVFVIKNEWPQSYAFYKARVVRQDSTDVLFEEEGAVREGRDLRVAIPAGKLGPGNFKLVIFGESKAAQLTNVANLNFEIQGE